MSFKSFNLNPSIVFGSDHATARNTSGFILLTSRSILFILVITLTVAFNPAANPTGALLSLNEAGQTTWAPASFSSWLMSLAYSAPDRSAVDMYTFSAL